MKLNGAYPDTPQRFHALIERTLDDLPQRAHRMPRARLLAVALVAMLLVGGAALAAARLGIIDMIYGERTPSDAARSSVVTSDVTDQCDRGALTLHQYLLDGLRLHVDYELSGSAEGAQLAIVDITATNQSGTELAYGASDFDVAQALGGEFDAAAQLYSGLYFYSMPAEPFTLTLRAYLIAPTLPIEAHQPSQAEAYGLPEPTTALQSGDAIAINAATGTAPLSDISGFDAACYGLISAGTDPLDAAAQALIDLGIARDAVPLELSVQIDPAKLTGALASLPEPVEYEFDEYTLRALSIDFTPASAYLHFEVHPRRPMAELTLTNDDPLYRWYECRYPDGTPIECVSGGGFSTMRDADGVYLDYELRLTGISDIPDEVLLTPYRTLPDGTREYAEDETVRIALAVAG